MSNRLPVRRFRRARRAALAHRRRAAPPPTGLVSTFAYNDVLGSLTVTDPVGSEPAALPAPSPLPFGDRFGFTARESDAETLLGYNRARYYDPTPGRWLFADIPLDPVDAELYRYPPPEPPAEPGR